MSFPGNAMAGGQQMQGAMMGYGNQNGMGGQYNNAAMMQMTPYGLSQQPPQQQQLGYMGGGGGGYGQPNGGMNNGMMMGGGGGGLAGPGQMLQIQAAPGSGYNQQQQQGGSRDPFSAFDGL